MRTSFLISSLPPSIFLPHLKSKIEFQLCNENTKKALLKDLRYWHAWFSFHNIDYTKVTQNVVKNFVIAHFRGLSPDVEDFLLRNKIKRKKGSPTLSTLKRRVSSLSIFLDLLNLKNPCRDKSVRKLLSILTQKSPPPQRKTALTKDLFDRLVKTCGSDLIDVRDRAILYFAFSSGGRRRSEVVNASFENLIKIDTKEYLYNLSSSKTNKRGNDDFKPIKGVAAEALETWLKASKITSGKIFRGVLNNQTLSEGLTDKALSRIVKKRAKKAGLDPMNYSAHSLRRGFVTECGIQGKPILDVMKMTSHKSVITVLQYYEAGNMLNNTCSQILG